MTRDEGCGSPEFLVQLDIHLRRDGLLHWHVDLVERLRALPGVTARVTWARGGEAEAVPACLPLLFRLEALLHGVGPHLTRPVGPVALGGDDTAARRGSADLTLDLAATSRPADGRWWLVFDGQPGLSACLGAVLDNRTPLVALLAASGRIVASGRPAVEAPHIALRSTEEVLARTTTLIVAAVGGVPSRVRDEDGAARQPAPAGCRRAAERGGKALARAALHRLYRSLYRTPHWRVGWRFVDGPDVFDLGRHPDGGWRNLPDDGTRFYADPFPIVVGGRTWMFMEDLPHATGKGLISAVEFGDAGPLGPPRPVLEWSTHLSYPFVVEEGGEVWMIPETSTSGRIELFRATRFPDGWQHEATLVEGVEASDATPFRHDGRWWMAATVRDGGGSWSDALHLWSAPALPGPWAPHRGNPVLIDSGSARPAGFVVERGGRLVRPVQDCRNGYGAALALAEITRLDDAAYEQRVVARIAPGPLWPGRKLHTLNRAGRLECIDGSALSARWRRGSVPG